MAKKPKYQYDFRVVGPGAWVRSGPYTTIRANNKKDALAAARRKVKLNKGERLQMVYRTPINL